MDSDDTPAPEPLGKQVLLAESTDDLWKTREGVREYLEQFGARVVPKGWYRQGAEGFRSGVKRDLESCDLFVQLLSDAPGRMPDDVPQGYPRLQYDLARAAGKPILQWRSPELNPDEVENEMVRSLLHEPKVRAEPIAHFKAKVSAMLRDDGSKGKPRPAMKRLIFVNREPNDKALAATIRRKLEALRANVVWPLESGEIGERRNFTLEALSQCDGVVLVHGSSPESWVSSQLLQCHKALADRDENWKGLALCRFPPMPKEELNMSLEDLHIFDCCDGSSRRQFHAFLKDLVAAVQA